MSSCRSTEWAIDRRECVGALWLACHEGRLDFAQWLCRSASFDAEAVATAQSRALRAALEGGHVGVAAWLFDTFPPPTRPIVAATFRRVCGRGWLEVAEWMADHLRVTAGDAKMSGAFGEACGEGHLEVAQWLTARFELSPGYVIMHSGACEAAARAPHRHVIDWLTTLV
jgi:hypothetical protein